MSYNMNRGYKMQEPPTSASFYKKMEQQRRKELARKIQEQNIMHYRMQQENNATLARYGRGNGAARPTRGNPRRESAPAIQYRKYLDDTTNVFYEDRKELVSIRKYEVYRPLVLKILFYLFLAWFVLFFVTPHKGICPQNADCGVYVYCKEGYNLVENKCVVSKQTKQKVSYLCESIINNMKYQYGNYDCQGQAAASKSAPVKNIQALYDQYDIRNRAAQEEMGRWFRDTKNQDKYGFSFYNNEVRPMVKSYTIFCKFHKIVGTRGFYVFFILFVLLALSMLCWLRLQAEKRRAGKIYKFLKKQVQQKGEITIEIEQIEKLHGHVYSQLWSMIDSERVDDKSIAYYQDEKLHWKLL